MWDHIQRFTNVSDSHHAIANEKKFDGKTIATLPSSKARKVKVLIYFTVPQSNKDINNLV